MTWGDEERRHAANLSALDKDECVPGDFSTRDQSALDVQVGGGHYKDMKIQPVEFSQKNKLTFCEASAIKYLCRHRHKNGLQDLEKAKHFIDLLIQLEYGEK